MKLTKRELYIAKQAYGIGYDERAFGCPNNPNWLDEVVDTQGRTIENLLAWNSPIKESDDE